MRLIIDIVIHLHIFIFCIMFEIGHTVNRYLKNRLCGI